MARLEKFNRRRKTFGRQSHGRKQDGVGPGRFDQLRTKLALLQPIWSRPAAQRPEECGDCHRCAGIAVQGLSVKDEARKLGPYKSAQERRLRFPAVLDLGFAGTLRRTVETDVEPCFGGIIADRQTERFVGPKS